MCRIHESQLKAKVLLTAIIFNKDDWLSLKISKAYLTAGNCFVSALRWTVCSNLQYIRGVWNYGKAKNNNKLKLKKE
jgi:hypothetical protein